MAEGSAALAAPILRGVGQPGVAHQREHLLGSLIGRQRVVRAFPVLARGAIQVDEVQLAAGAQHPPDLTHRLCLLARVEMMQHVGRQNPVDAAIGHRQRVGERPLEAYRQMLAGRLAAGPAQCRRIWIDAEQTRPWYPAAKRQQQVAGAATDLQHVVARLDIGPIQQLAVHPPQPGKTGDRVVEKQHPAAPHRRDVVPFGVRVAGCGHVALPSIRQKSGRTISVMHEERPDIGVSTAVMRQSSVPHAALTRLAGHTAHGVPIAAFRRVPGVPPVAVGHLPDHPMSTAVTPTGKAHTHDFLVLFYAHRANGTIRVDQRTWPVTDGDLFVIAPGQVMTFVDPPPHIVEDGWVVFFPADVIRTGAHSSWRAHPLLFPFARGIERAQRLRIPPAQRPSWLERLAALDAELRARRDGYQEAALAHLTLLLVAVSRLSTDVTGELRSADEPLLAAVFDVIERRYQEPISLADIAAELSLTAGHLTTVVRRKTGRTVQQWLTERRMQQARVLLADTGLTVAAIGRRVGYPDASYFIKRFRADHEVTPAQWRHAAV